MPISVRQIYSETEVLVLLSFLLLLHRLVVRVSIIRTSTVNQRRGPFSCCYDRLVWGELLKHLVTDYVEQLSRPF